MIRRKSFLLSLLLLPYLIWMIAAAFSLFLIVPILYAIAIPILLLGGELAPIGEVLGAIVRIAAAYTFGITTWGVPYALFASVFLFWSRNKSIKKIGSALICSPIILASIAVAVVMILDLFPRFSPRIIRSVEDWQDLQLISFRGVVICLAYGYILVGIGIVGYRLLDRRKFFKSESDNPQSIPASDTIPSSDNFRNGAS